MNKILNFSMCIILLSLMMSSCTDKEDAAKSTYSVRMTDAPGPYSAVNIDLQSVTVTGNGGAAVSLNVNPGIYNLLNFSNGLDTLIATGELSFTTVQQIRLILGPNNTIVVDGTTYPLSTPSAEQSGLKLQVHQTLEPGVAYSVLLDFDANESIVETGNGTYKLKPVIRTIESAISGSVRGSILPIGILATVSVTANSINYTSVVNAQGNFLISGLPAGTYSFTVTPAFPLQPVTVNNVVVSVGSSTQLGTIQL